MSVFPQMLFLNGHVRDQYGRPVHHSLTRIANSPEERETLRAEGFYVASPDEPAPPPAAIEGEPEPGDEALFNGADPAAFDHDGDGKPGGSLKKRK